MRASRDAGTGANLSIGGKRHGTNGEQKELANVSFHEDFSLGHVGAFRMVRLASSNEIMASIRNRDPFGIQRKRSLLPQEREVVRSL